MSSLLDDIDPVTIERVKMGLGLPTILPAEHEAFLRRQIAQGDRSIERALKKAIRAERKLQAAVDRKRPNEEKRPPMKWTLLHPQPPRPEDLGIKPPWQAVIHPVTISDGGLLSDIRPDLKSDAPLWGSLITWCYWDPTPRADANGVPFLGERVMEPTYPELFDAVILARQLGAALVRADQRSLTAPYKIKPRIDPSGAISAWRTPQHWDRFRDEHLLDWGPRIKALLEYIR